jgi:DNA polymerase I-like protein with 3'-5' exonuclease and polymerase domains
MSETLKIIRTRKDMLQLQQYLQDKQYVSFDTETTGVSKESEIIGFSVSADINSAYYVITAAWNVEKQVLEYLETKEEAPALLQSLVGKDLIMHNGLFDVNMVLNNYGIDLLSSLHTDTMILAHLLDENRPVGLKALALVLFGEDSVEEQKAMKASISKNGGVLTKDNYELFKGDPDLIALYGAKDALLTLKLFYTLVPDLYDQGLEDFFYRDESMPLLRGPTNDLNYTGLRVDPVALQDLRKTLEADCLAAKAFIYEEITPIVKDKYPGTTKANTFNIGSSKQLAWLCYFALPNPFHTLTKEGRNLCHALELKLPYTYRDKARFKEVVTLKKDTIWEQAKFNPKTKKMGRPKKVGDPWNYIACGKETLNLLKDKYKWVATFLEYAKNQKLLNTYVDGIQERMKYNVIRPSFLQHGTTSGRYSSKMPNFQNLPREDKRIKSCIVSRPGSVFVGADYSQLEPRVFASFANDKRLLKCFSNDEDFYSVIGAEVYDKIGYSLIKDAPNSFAKSFPHLRQIAKTIALAVTYGTTAPQMARLLGIEMDDAQEIIDNYLLKFPSVHRLMLDSHQMAKTDGQVKNLFGRPRRIPYAKVVAEVYKKSSHASLPYEARKALNLGVNHRIQSTAASIMNRAAIAAKAYFKELAVDDPTWNDVKIVLQVHDELILEGPEHLADDMVVFLQAAMEQTTVLPGVDLIAKPVVARKLSDLK